MLLDPLQARALLAFALERRFALLAVNADSPAAAADCLEAARQARAPIIIESSLWQLEGRSYGAGDAARGMARYIADLAILAGSDPYREIPVIYHTDHIKGPRTEELLSHGIRGIPVEIGGTALALSPSTVSLDSSELTDEENIDTICRLAAAAGEAGRPVTIEMEAGVDDGLTPPETTRRLVGGVEERHPGVVQLYAPGLGTRHGFSEEGFPAFRTEAVEQNIELVARITGRPVCIALHGSSGLPEDALRAAVAAGVAKVNWSSESLLIRSRAALDYYNRHGERLERTHPLFKQTAMDDGLQAHVSEAYVPKVIKRIRLLGGEGTAAEAMTRIRASRALSDAAV